MNAKWIRLTAVLGAVAFLGVLSGYSQDVTMKYLSPLNSSVTWDNAYYAGIYNGQIGTVSAKLICDDFQDQINSGDTWKASVLSASALGSLTSVQLSADTMFGSKIGASGYAQVAYLVSQIFTFGSGGGNPSNIQLSLAGVTVDHLSLADLSAVIWSITDSTLGGLSSNEAKLRNAVLNLYTTTDSAQSYLSSLTNLWLYTPDPNRHGGGQEMWSQVAVPEGGENLLYLLLAGTFIFGAIYLRSKSTIAV